LISDLVAFLRSLLLYCAETPSSLQITIPRLDHPSQRTNVRHVVHVQALPAQDALRGYPTSSE